MFEHHLNVENHTSYLKHIELDQKYPNVKDLFRIMHPNSPTYINKPIERDHKEENKRTYNGPVIQVEKGTFTPIVMSTFGGMGVEAHNFHQHIATLISEKLQE